MKHWMGWLRHTVCIGMDIVEEEGCLCRERGVGLYGCMLQEVGNS